MVDANWTDSTNGGRLAYDPDSTIAGSQPYSDFATLPGFPEVLTISPPDFDEAEQGAPYNEIFFEDHLQWYGTARLRVGLTPGGSRFLLYGTGGLAFGGVESQSDRTTVWTGDEADFQFANNPTPGPPVVNNDSADDEYAPGLVGVRQDLSTCEEIVAVGGNVQNRTGVVCRNHESDEGLQVGFSLGAGADLLLTDNFSLGGEFLYVNLGDPHFDFFGTDHGDVDFMTVQLRGSYRFRGLGG